MRRRAPAAAAAAAAAAARAALALLLLACRPPGARAFALWAVEHRPTYVPDEASGQLVPRPPTDLRHLRLGRAGIDFEKDSSVAMSRFTHLGCFEASLSISKHINPDSNYDPNECIDYCLNVAYPNASQFSIIVAVHQDRCGCVQRDMTQFREVDKSFCTFYCKYYRNPICGGFLDGRYFWGVFKEYDYQFLGAQGAYDPWRYVWYTVVVIREESIKGSAVDEKTPPERYFLHAAETYGGLAQFQFQLLIESGILYGIQYDIDSSRLAGLYTPISTGRMRQDAEWQYKLATIVVNTSDGTLPRMEFSLSPIQIQVKISENYLAFSGASAIISRKVNCYMFTQSEPASAKKDTKDRIYFVRIPDGYIIAEASLDFKVLQLLANEMHGDVSAVGPRYEVSLGASMQNYVYLARVWRSEVEDRTMVDWQYNLINPIRIVPLTLSGDWLLHPGIVASDHIYNKSAIAHRYVPPDRPDLAAMTITEVNIRTSVAQSWCSARACQGTLHPEVPYAGIFNKEPGIPLSLKAPSFTSARFTIEAQSIIVDWDRATLKGARTVDDNGDYMPDRIDYSTQPQSEFNCGEVFDPPSVLRLGPYPDTSCLWQSASRIIIYLPTTGINVSVGDDLFVLPDTIYTPPRDDEWSPAASGGVQVEGPYPLDDPVVILSGSTTVDRCSPVRLDASASFQTGGLPRYAWSLPAGTPESENPRDLTNSPTRVFDQAKIQAIRDALANATAENSPVLLLDSTLMEEASQYRVTLTLTSRWLVYTNKTVQLTKLSFSAPMVSILGPEVMWKNRTERVALESVGVPSGCSGSGWELRYRWTCSSGNLDFGDYPSIITDVHTLVIPKYTLLPPGESSSAEYATYNFTVECWNGRFVQTPERTASATVSVNVRRSPVYVVFRQGSRLLTRGDILILDARSSQDPDFPTQDGHTFRGTFQWRCLTPDRRPCFAGSSTGMIASPSVCRRDVSSRIQDGLVTFYAPVFDDLEYCQHSRGVMMFQTTDFELGEYKFSVEIEHIDGRRASKDVFIELTDVRVPRIVLTIQEERSRYSVTDPIRITGTEEGQTTNISRTYTWSVFVYERNPAYDNERAIEMGNDPLNPYTVDMHTFIDVTSRFDFRDDTQFFYSNLLPNLQIRENTLQASTTYKFRLNINLVNVSVSGYSDIAFTTAGLKPRGGRFEVEPINGTMDIGRKLKAPSWVADDSPLTYDFGYVANFPGSAGTVEVKFTTEPVPVPEMMQYVFPLGDASNNYSLELFVRISTPFGAAETVFTTINSWPVENVTRSTQEGLVRARTVDEASLMGQLDQVLSMDPTNRELQNQLIEIMGDKADSVPPTANQLVTEARIIETIIQTGNTGDNVLRQLEDLVIRVANADVIEIDRTRPGGPLADLLLSGMGGLLPGPDDDAAAGGSTATGQSTVMGRYLSPNPRFAFRDAGPAGAEPAELQWRAGARRQRRNHPRPAEGQRVVPSCPSVFCDRPLLACYPKDRPGASMHVCCDEANPETLCNDPPCWFRGIQCPGPRALEAAAGQPGRLPPGGAAPAAPPAPPPASWLDSWLGYNFPLKGLREEEISDWERVNGYHGWHPDVRQRRLQALALNRTQSAPERVRAMEAAERELVASAQRLVRASEAAALGAQRADATEQVSYGSMTPQLAQRLREQFVSAEEAAHAYRQERERNLSARITSLTVSRDIVAKALVRMMNPNEDYTHTSRAYTMTIGQTNDLTSVHPAFVFPERFKVSAGSPQNPTSQTNATGFGYIFIQHNKNIYYWSDSAPPSNESMLITLMVFYANTNDIEVRSVETPIRVFADKLLFSNAVCLYWDRFAPYTEGGKWSSQGVVNDENGCITTHLSDFAVFMDGRAFSGSRMVDIASDSDREVFESTCIGCGGEGGSEMNLIVIVELGMVLVMNLLLVLMGFVADELKRGDMKRNRVTSRYYYDGDGLEKPLSVDDPISYADRDNLPMLCLRTMLNVTFREHAIIATIFYHETFTRPQRMWCFGALLMGLMAINAIVHGNPGHLQETRQYIVSGVLSGLLVFPIFCGLLLMFNMRPAAIKKRLIKRAYSTREVDLLNEQRQKLAHKTALRPAPGYLALPPPAGSTPGQATLLTLPAPLPLPPLPGVGGGPGQLALPPPPASAGVLPGTLPALPALPGMTANMPLPAAPKYPPPPKNARVPPPNALMPPLVFKPGPPPPPFPRAQAPDGSGGTYTHLPLHNAPDTGATPLQLPEAPFGTLPALGLTGEAPLTLPAPATPPRSFGAEAPVGNELEATPPPLVAREDARHGMAPGGLPGSVGGDPSMPTPTRPPGSMTPPGMSPRTPNAATPAGGTPREPPPPPAGPQPGTPGPSTPGTQRSSLSRIPGQTTLVPQEAGMAMPLFIRGAPPPGLPPPFAPAPPGPSGMSPWVMPGMPQPGPRPPMPAGVSAPGAPLPPLQTPIPPPPPREDDQAFVRRIKLTYTSSVMREHERHDLLEDMDKLGTSTPDWVFDAMTLMPYLTCCIFTLVSIVVVLQYGTKFQKWQEDYWIKGSLIGLAMVLLLLEFFRIAMMTLVELRKFENRKKAKAGHFLPRRVRRDDDKSHQEVPAPRLLKRTFVAPAVPMAAIEPGAQISRPAFLPQEGNRLPALPAGARTPPGAQTPPGARTPPGLMGGGVGNLPVAKAPPGALPQFSGRALAAGGLSEPRLPPVLNLPAGGAGASPGPGTPKSVLSATGGGLGGTGGPPGGFGGFGGAPGGAPGGPGPPRPGGGSAPGTPKLQSAAELLRQGAGPAPPSPTHSTHSLRSAVQSLNQQVQAGRRNTPPPRPAQPRSSGGAQTPPQQPPPAPSNPPPSWSRPPSRPTSASSAAVPARAAQAKPPAPG